MASQQRRAIEQAEILFLAAETIFFKERALLLACLLELLKVAHIAALGLIYDRAVVTLLPPKGCEICW